MANNNMLYFRNVSEDDYAVMKAEEPHIVKEVKSRLYERGVTPTERKLPSFVYNQRKQIVALYFQEGRKSRKEDRRLILRREDFNLMSDIERKMFHALRNILKEGLEGIK